MNERQVASQVVASQVSETSTSELSEQELETVNGGEVGAVRDALRTYVGGGDEYDWGTARLAERMYEG
jgi:bacteriocin-like protein